MLIRSKARFGAGLIFYFIKRTFRENRALIALQDRLTQAQKNSHCTLNFARPRQEAIHWTVLSGINGSGKIVWPVLAGYPGRGRAELRRGYAGRTRM